MGRSWGLGCGVERYMGVLGLMKVRGVGLSENVGWGRGGILCEKVGCGMGLKGGRERKGGMGGEEG